MIKHCRICGSAFKSPPSAKTVTCSNSCRRERARRANTAKNRKWSARAVRRLSARGQTGNLRKGTAAALASPLSGPFETNRNALEWTIQSPSGRIYNVRNLSLWLRRHRAVLPGTVQQARSGLMQIKRSMLGKTRRPVGQWKGWRLLGWRRAL